MIDPRPARIILAALALGFGLAAGPPPAPVPQLLFACALGAKRVTVMQGGGSLTYSYGRPGKPELAMTKALTDPALGHRYQLWPHAEHRHLRFSQGGYDYVIFHRFSAPDYNHRGAEDRQGLLVLKQGRVLMRRHCDDVVSFAPGFDFTRLHQDEADLSERAGQDPFNRP